MDIIYSSKPSVGGRIFHKELPNKKIKQMVNNIQFKKEMNLLIKRCYYSIQGYLKVEL
jgi:hypothetical protein